MTKKKNETAKSETKAGMLGKDYDSEARAEKQEKSENRTENTPKISKNQAEGEHGDKPLH